MEKLLTPEQVADTLQVSVKTIKNWLRAGRLKGVKTGQLWRIEPEALRDYMSQRRLTQIDLDEALYNSIIEKALKREPSIKPREMVRSWNVSSGIYMQYIINEIEKYVDGYKEHDEVDWEHLLEVLYHLKKFSPGGVLKSIRDCEIEEADNAGQ